MFRHPLSSKAGTKQLPPFTRVLIPVPKLAPNSFHHKQLLLGYSFQSQSWHQNAYPTRCLIPGHLSFTICIGTCPVPKLAPKWLPHKMFNTGWLVLHHLYRHLSSSQAGTKQPTPQVSFTRVPVFLCPAPNGFLHRYLMPFIVCTGTQLVPNSQPRRCLSPG